MRFSLQWGQATVRAVTQLTPAIRQIEIVPSGGTVEYTVGSHINVAVLVNEQPELRSYSLVGQHAIGRAYKIAVKLQPDSRGGSRYMWGLAPGSRLEISSPQNLFELSSSRPHYMLIAGGIGITPIVSMAQRLVAQGASFELLYAARSRSDLAFVSELEYCIGPRLHVFVSGEGATLNFEEVFSGLPSGAEAYLCGPMRMLEVARHTWNSLGRPMADFRFETFGSSGRFPREAFEVIVRDRGLRVLVPPEWTMIDALLASGVEIMSDCMRGECGLCLVDVVGATGEIDHRDVFLSDEQKRAGKRVCVCVSRIVGGDVEIDTGFRLSGGAINRMLGETENAPPAS